MKTKSKFLKEKLVGVDEFASITLMSPRNVYKLATNRILPPIKSGKIPLIEGLQRYTKFLAEKRDTIGPQASILTERTRLTGLHADVAEHERQMLFHSLVPVEDIETSWQQFTGSMAEHVRALPARAAGKVAGVKTPAQAQVILAGEVAAVLAAISGKPLDIVRTLAPWEPPH